MGQDLEINVLSRARTLLGVDDSVMAAQLYSMLREYRIHVHPDKFHNDDQRKTAELKFKEVQGLLDELTQYIQNIELTRTPSELVLYEPEIARIYLMREIDFLKEENDLLKTKLKDSAADIEQLTDERDREKDKILEMEKLLNERAQEVLKSEAKEIESLYKSALQSFAPAGIAVILTVTLSILAKIEGVTNLIRQYSPSTGEQLNVILLLIIATSVIWSIKNILENSLLHRRAREISSPHFCEQFVNYLKSVKGIDPNKINILQSKKSFYSSVENPNGGINRWPRLGS